jgi:ABC-type glycerol-3-phosphate transport system substrate-binding protein
MAPLDLRNGVRSKCFAILGRKFMARIDRRRLLKLSGAGAVAASTGGIAGILTSGRAPAYGQAASIHWLRWSDFVPASDQLLRNKIVPQCEKDIGIKLTLETVNANDIQARVTSAVQSGSGPDIIMVVNNWPRLYEASVADVSDVAEEIGRAQGGYYDIATQIDNVGGKWIGVPWAIGGGLLTNRKSWFAENIARWAKSSRPRAAPLDKPLAIPSGTRRVSGIPTSGRGAARRSRPTARPSPSTARRQSSR